MFNLLKEDAPPIEWANKIKNIVNWEDNKEKHTSNFSNKSKNTTIWDNEEKTKN